MKIGFEVSGGSPANSYALQEATASGFDAVESSFHVEHDGDGRHSVPFESLEVDGDVTLGGVVTLEDDLLMTGEYGVTLSANTHNLAQTNGLPITSSVIRVQGTAAWNFTGLVPPTSAIHIRLIENGGSFTITLSHNSSSSTAGNRFNTPSGADYALLSGQFVLVKYDPHSDIWRLLTPGLSTVIRTIQSGSIAIGPGFGTNTATLATAVDTNKSYVLFRGAGIDTSVFMPGTSVTLTNSTTVTAVRAGAADTVTVAYTVVEYI